MILLPRFQPGRRVLGFATVAGVIGLGLTAVRIWQAPEIGLAAYLVAFSYWLGLSLGALILLAIFHASHARWPVVLRRLLEVMAATVTLFPLLFVPIALGLGLLYPWAGAHPPRDTEIMALLAHRASLFNVSFFLGRALIYFLVWIVVSRLLLAWSTAQDTGLRPELTARIWKWGAGALPAIGFTLTFASIDWLMSLSARFASSLWGIYVFAGAFVGAIALLIVLVVAASHHPAFAGVLRPEHYLSLGKLLLAFVCFWAYIAFAQYMLVWIANLPEESSFILSRQKGAWGAIGVALALGHFALPFFLLLSRARKMNPGALAAIAAQILVMHALDLCWVVMPEVHKESRAPLDWSLLSSLVGVGGLTFAYGLLLLRGRHAVPIGDPFLHSSLEYART